jgi:DNA-binding FrmR family transcriptional regulator
MDEDLQDFLRQLRAHREAMRRLKEHIAAGRNIDIPEELHERVREEQEALNRIQANLIEFLQDDSFHDYYKPGTSLIWNLKGNYREQT